MSAQFSGSGDRTVYDIGDLEADGVIPEEELDVLAYRAPDGVRRQTYDKAFEPAVAEGLLTVQAAWARGSREAYGILLQRRYELSSNLALDVADNRISLLEALEILDRQKTGMLPDLGGSPRRLHWSMIPVAIVVVGLVILLGRYGEQLWESQGRIARELEQLSFAAAAPPPVSLAPQAQSATVAAGLKVQRDEVGRVTRVSAGKPSAVLEKICTLGSSSESCEWMEVHHTVPRYPGYRIGRFATSPDDRWVVRIRLDRSAGRWFVGTGLRPIEPIPDNGEYPVPGLYPGGMPGSTLAASNLGR